jgi:hypothetical protein
MDQKSAGTVRRPIAAATVTAACGRNEQGRLRSGGALLIVERLAADPSVTPGFCIGYWN